MLFVFGLLLIEQTCYAQSDSSLVLRRNKVKAKDFILPSSLCLTGILVKQTNFPIYLRDKVQNSSLRTHTSIDDYTRYIPVVEMYISDIFYKKSKNEVFHQTKNYILARLLTSFTTNRIKDWTQVTRPDGTERSFPSGHTSYAFTGATALYLEYRDKDKLLAYSGFAFATATGFMRITNNRHWVSDVITGAGVGMISTTLVWYLNPFGNWMPFKEKRVSIYPFINNPNSFGICMVF